MIILQSSGFLSIYFNKSGGGGEHAPRTFLMTAETLGKNLIFIYLFLFLSVETSTKVLDSKHEK